LEQLVTAFVISIVAAVLTTGGAAAALHHIGRALRQHKNHRRHLDMTTLNAGAQLSLVAVTVLVGLVAASAFYRVWSEGMFSGLDELALLLAALVAAVMLVSAALVFGTAFHDGSPAGDDLRYYSRLVNRHLAIHRDYERTADECQREIERLQGFDNLTTSRAFLEVTGAAHGSPSPRPAIHPGARSAVESGPQVTAEGDSGAGAGS
jgi:hypothetical protein